MKFSRNALKTYLPDPPDTEKLIVYLNRIGLEVESVEPAAFTFSGVVVAEILTVSPHPNADKLQCLTVSTEANHVINVVCGAKNVYPGLKVAFATVGAKLGSHKIKKAKIRGAESHGMVCSETELGLTEGPSDGIWQLPKETPIGIDLNEYLTLPDDIIEIDVTPNRADCLSIQGIARDLGVVMEKTFEPLQTKPNNISHQTTQNIDIEDPKACLRYVGRLIKGIDREKASPIWLREALRRAGIRPIHPVVDVTNYVMIQLGQPMHAFDHDTLSGDICVRQSADKENILLIDGQTLSLNKDTLVIADEKGPIALAGIMGGLNTSVQDHTVDIFFESAAFSPEALMGKAREYGLHTDSSHRFERGVSPELSREAIEYATTLLLSITGGEAGPVIDVKSNDFIKTPKKITLRYERIEEILGVKVDTKRIENILKGLAFSFEYYPENQSWSVDVPSFRFDIDLEIDLIEEIARIIGYDTIPATHPSATLVAAKSPGTTLAEENVLEKLCTLGYSEIISYSFLDPKRQEPFSGSEKTWQLLNPISNELSEMRISLWPNLLQAVKYNQARQMLHMRLFESGLIFRQSDHIEQRQIAGVIVGQLATNDWSQASRAIDFFDIKGDVEILLASTRQTFHFKKSSHPTLHPEQSANILNERGEIIGTLGILHPMLEKTLDLKGPTALFELNWEIFENVLQPAFSNISRFPMIRRDLALLISKTEKAIHLKEVIRQEAGNLFYDCVIFDLYEGSGIPENKKSLALSIYLQAIEKTFTENEINDIMERILHSIQSKCGAELRG